MSGAPARRRLGATAGAAWMALALTSATPAVAQDDACGDLWYRRNAEFKAAGYCFRTPRAIRAFGNAGCAYDDLSDVPLSRGQRAIVAEIVERERALGCR